MMVLIFSFLLLAGGNTIPPAFLLEEEWDGISIMVLSDESENNWDKSSVIFWRKIQGFGLQPIVRKVLPKFYAIQQFNNDNYSLMFYDNDTIYVRLDKPQKNELVKPLYWQNIFRVNNTKHLAYYLIDNIPKKEDIANGFFHIYVDWPTMDNRLVGRGLTDFIPLTIQETDFVKITGKSLNEAINEAYFP